MKPGSNQEKEEKEEKEEKLTIEQEREILKKEVFDLCEHMCLDILQQKPENVTAYMIEWLQEKYQYTSSGLKFDEKKELERLRNDVDVYRVLDEHNYYLQQQKADKKDSKGTGKGGNPKGGQQQKSKQQRLPPDSPMVSEDEEICQDDIDQNLDNLDYIKSVRTNSPRIGVCENVYGKYNPFTGNEGKIKTFKKTPEQVEFIRINLIKNPIFSQLSLNELKSIIDCMEEKSFPAVNDIVKQGEHGETFFFVEEGDLECKVQFTKVIKEGKKVKYEKCEPKLVKVYTPGDFFGELSLLYNIPRRGTIKTVTDVKAFVLDRKTFKKIINDSNNNKIAKRIEKLKKIEIFTDLELGDEEFQILEQLVKEGIFSKGEKIIQEGDPSNALYIIEEGSCIGTKTFEKGKTPEKTNDYKEGDVLCETSLLKAERVNENIIAKSDIVKLACIDRYSVKANLGSLEAMLIKNPDLYNKYFPPLPEPEKPKEDEKKDEDKKEEEKKEDLQKEDEKKEEIPDFKEFQKKIDLLQEEKKKIEDENNKLRERLKVLESQPVSGLETHKPIDGLYTHSGNTNIQQQQNVENNIYNINQINTNSRLIGESAFNPINNEVLNENLQQSQGQYPGLKDNNINNNQNQQNPESAWQGEPVPEQSVQFQNENVFSS